MDRYRPQLKSYQQVLSHMLRIDASQIGMQLIFTAAGRVAAL